MLPINENYESRLSLSHPGVRDLTDNQTKLTVIHCYSSQPGYAAEVQESS